MTLYALSSWEANAWIATLVVGVVVLVVVLALLETLRRQVVALLGGVEAVLSMGGQLAQNTWAAQLLATTRARGLDLLGLVKSASTKGNA